MVKLTEELDNNLQQIYKTLDDYCSKNNINYSIDCDEANEQGYLISKNSKIHDLVDHMKKQIEAQNNKIVMTINPQPSSPLNIGTLPSVRKDGTLLHFAIKSIQDSIVQGEDQIKSPTTKYLRSQAPYRSSFGKAKSFGGITKSTYKESTMLNMDPFSDRLHNSLNEHIEISFAEPDVLFAHTQHPADEAPNKTESIKQAIALESQILEQYMSLIETTKDEELLVVLESTVERCNDNIRKLETLLVPVEKAVSEDVAAQAEDDAWAKLSGRTMARRLEEDEKEVTQDPS